LQERWCREPGWPETPPAPDVEMRNSYAYLHVTKRPGDGNGAQGSRAVQKPHHLLPATRIQVVLTGSGSKRSVQTALAVFQRLGGIVVAVFVRQVVLSQVIAHLG